MDWREACSAGQRGPESEQEGAMRSGRRGHGQGRRASQVDPAFPGDCRMAAQRLGSGQLEEHVAPCHPSPARSSSQRPRQETAQQAPLGSLAFLLWPWSPQELLGECPSFGGSAVGGASEDRDKTGSQVSQTW